MSGAAATSIAPAGQDTQTAPSGASAQQPPTTTEAAKPAAAEADPPKKRKRTKEERKASRKATQDKLRAIKDGINKEADKTLREAFPIRIAELDALLKELPTLLNDLIGPSERIVVDIPEDESEDSKEETSSSEPPAKRRKLNPVGTAQAHSKPHSSVKVWRKKAPRTEAEIRRTHTTVECHPQITEVTNRLKKMLMEMIRIVSMVKISISLRIPKMEDGNNFGVGVQEEALGALEASMDLGMGYYDRLTKYFQLRAKLVSKVFKWPYVEDYRDAVREVDEKAGVTLRTTARELRQTYLVLWDLITKNMAKLKNPRNQSSARSFIY